MARERDIINTKKLGLIAIAGVLGFSFITWLESSRNFADTDYNSLINVVPDTTKDGKLPDNTVNRYLFGVPDLARHYSNKFGTISFAADVMDHGIHFAIPIYLKLDDKDLFAKITNFSRRISSYGEKPNSFGYNFYYQEGNAFVQMASSVSLDRNGRQNIFSYTISINDPDNKQLRIDGFQFNSQASTGYPPKTMILMFNRNIQDGPKEANKKDLERILINWREHLPKPIEDYINLQLAK